MPPKRRPALAAPADKDPSPAVRAAAPGTSSGRAAAPPTRDPTPAGYATFFAEVAARVRAAHLKAAAAVNRELITLYWDLGREIVARQQREGWGARAFYLAYAGAPTAVAEAPANRQQAVAETVGDATGSAPPPAGAALPWGHNLLLLEKLDDPALRLWYADQTTRHGWSRNVLALQVQSRLHARVGRADQTTDFSATLPPPRSDLAREVIKDPYNFEFLTVFLTVAQGAHERHVEARLIAHMREFLLELGTGFLYAGSQYKLVVGGDEFFLDPLFYHKRLRCWVVLDLKTGEFRPEYAGKMHFYLNVVDDQLRDAGDQPSIGLILCRSKNAVVAEYALRGVASPVGVAEYRVTDATEGLPAELRAALPSLEAVRAELEAAPLDGEPEGPEGPEGPAEPTTA